VGVHKIITVALVLSVFLSQRTTAQTAPCVSLTLPSSELRSATVSDPASGTVIMRVQVSKSGLIHDIEIFSGPSALATPATELVKRWEYKPADWVSRPLTDRYTFLSVTVQKGSAPMIAEVEQSVPGGIPACIQGGSPAPNRDQIAIAWILSSISPQIPRIAPPTRIRVTSAVMRPFLLKKVTPDYPPEAAMKQIGGKVAVHVIIDTAGNVSKVDAESGDPLLIDAAIQAVKQWKYKPYLLNQKAVEVETILIIDFLISGGSRSVVIASLR
jgi:TonB family protein